MSSASFQVPTRLWFDQWFLKWLVMQTAAASSADAVFITKRFSNGWSLFPKFTWPQWVNIVPFTMLPRINRKSIIVHVSIMAWIWLINSSNFEINSSDNWKLIVSKSGIRRPNSSSEGGVFFPWWQHHLVLTCTFSIFVVGTWTCLSEDITDVLYRRFSLRTSLVCCIVESLPACLRISLMFYIEDSLLGRHWCAVLWNHYRPVLGYHWCFIWKIIS